MLAEFTEVTGFMKCEIISNIATRFLEHAICRHMATGVGQAWTSQLFCTIWLFFIMVFAYICGQYLKSPKKNKIAVDNVSGDSGQREKYYDVDQEYDNADDIELAGNAVGAEFDDFKPSEEGGEGGGGFFGGFGGDDGGG